MKTWRRKFVGKTGVVVRYTGMFQCLCGGRTPFIDVFHSAALLDEWPRMPFKVRRQLMKIRRRDALETLQTFAETSELCHDEEDHRGAGEHRTPVPPETYSISNQGEDHGITIPAESR